MTMTSEKLIDVINYINTQIDDVEGKKADYNYEDFITIIHSLQVTRSILIDCKNRLLLREEIEREVREEIEE